MRFKGFTLIEVLITAVIAGFLGTGSLYLISNSNKSLTDGAVEIFKSGNVQMIMSQIATDIHQGAKLQRPSYNTLLVTDFEDNPLFQWVTNVTGGHANDTVTRTVWNPDGTMTTNDIFLVSSQKRKMVPYVSYEPPMLTGSFYYVDVSVHILEVIEGKSTYDSWTRTVNRLYCRLNPDQQ